ncbi:MAG: NmrA family NAD(P)-binding protein [Thermodesulfobacteriota bacterium]|nr:NmrA family NAD(P)-binding protein [Thermodesulfobacteriota bacterium]
MKKVLVIGATGYLGRFVVQEFKKRGYWVRALARNPQKLEKTGPFLEPAVKDQTNKVFVGEVTRPETLRGLCDGIDIVFSSLMIMGHPLKGLSRVKTPLH